MWITEIAIDIVTSLSLITVQVWWGQNWNWKKVQAKEDIALSQDQYIGPSDIWEGKTHWFQICAEGRIYPCLSVRDG